MEDGDVANADVVETSIDGAAIACGTAQTRFATTSAAALANRTPKNEQISLVLENRLQDGKYGNISSVIKT